MGSMNSCDTLLVPLDFDGDGLLDIFSLTGAENEPADIYLNEIMAKNLRFHTRNSVKPISELWNDEFVYDVLPHTDSDRKDNLILVQGNILQKIRYVDDEAIFVHSRCLVFDNIIHYEPIERDRNLPTRVHQIAIVQNKIFKNLIVSASRENQTNFYLIQEPFRSFGQNYHYQTSQVHPLPGITTRLWAGQIDSDELDDLFFECNGSWHIWFANTDGDGYAPEGKGHSLTIPIPLGVKRAIDVQWGERKNRLLVSVESEPGSEIAYVALPRGALDRPIPVTIPGKASQGTITRLFQFFHPGNGEPFPVFLISNRLNQENPQPNTFYIYLEEIDPLSIDVLTPKLAQIFQPDYRIEHPANAYQYYFDQPVSAGDYDGDGYTDLAFSAKGMPLPISESQRIVYRFLGFYGVGGNTEIGDWSVYE